MLMLQVLYWYRLFIVYIINNISRLYCVYELTPSLPNNLKIELKRNSLLQYIGKNINICWDNTPQVKTLCWSQYWFHICVTAFAWL